MNITVAEWVPFGATAMNFGAVGADMSLGFPLTCCLFCEIIGGVEYWECVQR